MAELLDVPEPRLLLPGAPEQGWDAQLLDEQERTWHFEVKSASTPGLIARAAENLARVADHDAISVLVVPFMTPAGARTAAKHELNWIDLSGNARVRADQLYVSREGRPNAFPARGRPASAFAPVSARVARQLLADPKHWWLQKDLATSTGLDAGRVSRIVRKLDDDGLLARRGREVRPADPALLLDAWADAYRFDQHDIVLGHASGSGVELARGLSASLASLGIRHALTGLPAAWLLDRFASFRLSTIYVEGDPREAADRLELRQHERGANVQIVGPNDLHVMSGASEIEGTPVVAAAQVYLDLLAMPERAREAAEHLCSAGKLWPS